jgi:hypothetical protein
VKGSVVRYLNVCLRSGRVFDDKLCVVIKERGVTDYLQKNANANRFK